MATPAGFVLIIDNSFETPGTPPGLPSNIIYLAPLRSMVAEALLLVIITGAVLLELGRIVKDALLVAHGVPRKDIGKVSAEAS